MEQICKQYFATLGFALFWVLLYNLITKSIYVSYEISR